jgi:SAM-dependent methyltransferase
VVTPFYGADLAYIHHVGFGDFAAAAAGEFASLLTRAGITSGHILDLGCGSGILARELTALGYDVTGIDRSAEMLALAATTAPRATFVQGDIREMALPRCRAAFAIGEAFAYLPPGTRSPPSLRSAFTRVARAVEPGGLFVFDLITAGGGPLMAYRSWQAGSDWAVLVDVREDRAARIVQRQITAFRRNGGGYQRTDERHAVGVYARSDVEGWLSAAGFPVRVQRRYGRVALPPRRVGFVARREPGALRQSGGRRR